MLGSSPARDGSVGKKLIKDYVFIPAGGEGDTVIPEFYISSIEITNAQYREFITDLRDSGSTEKLKLAMVDSAQWGKFFPPSDAYTNYYFQHKAYDDYPVVNISKRGAELYCEWLTERYNRTSSKKVRFSLPTEAQWTYAAKGGNPKAIYPWPGNSIFYQKKGKLHGARMCNYRVDTVRAGTVKQSDSTDVTAPSRSFMPNTYEIYNMSGNVAEMLSDQPYTKGGSYWSRADKVLISAHEDADLSHGYPFIGFRPVMVYVGEN
jgi:formylglycine-generating enzyme required for sulfatase activity